MPTYHDAAAESPRRLSISRLAALAGMSPRTVSNRLRSAGLAPVARDGRTLWYDPQAAFPVIFGGDTQSERGRLDAARADAQEMANAQARAELLHAHEVNRIGAEVAAVIWTRVLAMRAVGPVARAAATDAEAADRTEDEARAALADLAGLGDPARRAAGAGRRRR